MFSLHFTFSNTADIFKVFNVKYLNRKNGKKKVQCHWRRKCTFFCSLWILRYVIKTAKGWNFFWRSISEFHKIIFLKNHPTVNSRCSLCRWVFCDSKLLNLVRYLISTNQVQTVLDLSEFHYCKENFHYFLTWINSIGLHFQC